MAQLVKNLQQCRRMPAIQEIWVGSLGWEDSLEEEMDSSILGWRIPWTEEPGRLTVHGVAKSWTQLSDGFLVSPLSSVPQWACLSFLPPDDSGKTSDG